MRKSGLLSILLFASLAQADKLDDFQDAATHQGCDAIPYSDLSSTCRSQQSEVHPWCDGDRGPVVCEKLVTRNLRADLIRDQQNLDALDQKRHDIIDKRDHAADDAEKSKWTAELDAVDREIEATKNRIDDGRSKLDKRKDLVDKTMYTLNKCIDYRKAVMNVFGYATDKVRGETDPDLRPYANRLREKYAGEIEGHEEAINNRQAALDTCRQELP